MISKEKIARINELAKKAKSGSLTDEEKQNSRSFARNTFKASARL